MKCSNCGYEESRPNARFCKKCGQPMAAQPAPPVAAAAPPSPPVACPHCGSPVKPGARFCPRCGKAVAAALSVAGPPPAPGGYVPPPAQPLPPTQPSMAAAQPPAMYPPTQPAMAAGQQYATPPSAPPSLAEPGAASLPAGPTAPTAGRPAAKKTGVLKWLWIVVVGVLLVCLIAVVVLAVVFRSSWLPLLEAEPSPTPTEQVPVSAPLSSPVFTPTATTNPSLEPTATETPPSTQEPVSPPASTEPPPPPFELSVTPVVTELAPSEILQVIVVFTNASAVEVFNLHYELIDVDPSVLKSDQPLTVDHQGPIPAGGSDQAQFLLRAVSAGSTYPRVRVRVEARTDPPTPQEVMSEPVTITVH